jgi:hypothetical protein
VSALSRRHHIAVRLNTNLYGGTQAVVVIPRALIGAERQETPTPPRMAPEPAEPVAALTASAPDVLLSTPLSGSGHAIPMPQPSGPDTAAAPLAGPSAGAPRNEPGAAASVRPPNAPTGANPAGAPGQRPELPRRRAQQNLTPELLHAPAPRDDDDTDSGHNPGLMAAFQQGMRSGRDDPADPAGDAG